MENIPPPLLHSFPVVCWTEGRSFYLNPELLLLTRLRDRTLSASLWIKTLTCVCSLRERDFLLQVTITGWLLGNREKGSITTEKCLTTVQWWEILNETNVWTEPGQKNSKCKLLFLLSRKKVILLQLMKLQFCNNSETTFIFLFWDKMQKHFVCNNHACFKTKLQ